MKGKLEDVVREVYEVTYLVRPLAKEQKYVDVLVSKCPKEMLDISRRVGEGQHGSLLGGAHKVNESSLAHLHAKLKTALSE